MMKMLLTSSTFNINSKNYASDLMKDKLRRSKNNKDKCKQSKSARKITKLQSKRYLFLYILFFCQLVLIFIHFG